MSTGQRIAAWRVYRGMTQEVCAGLAGKSLSWWKKVEGGQRRLEKLADVIAIARILRVPELADLTGVLEFSLGRDQMRPVPVLPGIRAAMLRLQPPSGEPVPLADLQRRYAEARDTFHRHRMFVSEVGRVLPGLIDDATAAYRRADEATRRAVAGVLSDVYLLACQILRDAGDFPLAMTAIDRCHHYAREADDPLRMAWAAWDSSGVLKDLGSPEEGLSHCQEALAGLESLAAATPTDPVLSALGEMCGQAALMHGHLSEEGHALGMLDRGARVYARITPGFRNPTTGYAREGSDVIGVWVYTALGKGRTAVRVADTVDITATPSRPVQALWTINVARGYASRNEDTGTLHMMRRAEDIAPEIVARSTHVREMVRDMIRRDRRTVSPDVHQFARRIGLLS
ncbi:MAG TPA: helix-turn-helix transcriptional regulator [Mycobacteriales bacterium]|nr:helix-turn-helix transcriptional regulator [Mycobacteriales bacterium]